MVKVIAPRKRCQRIAFFHLYLHLNLKNMKYITPLFLIAFCLFSCKKEEPEPRQQQRNNPPELNCECGFIQVIFNNTATVVNNCTGNEVQINLGLSHGYSNGDQWCHPNGEW